MEVEKKLAAERQEFPSLKVFAAIGSEDAELLLTSWKKLNELLEVAPADLIMDGSKKEKGLMREHQASLNLT